MEFLLFTKRVFVLNPVFPWLESVSPPGSVWTFGRLEVGDLQGL